MIAHVLPLVWFAAAARSLPEGLPLLSDLAPVEPGAARLGVVGAAVPSADAPAAAARLARLPGCAMAGWLEADRVVVLRGGRPETAWRRVGGGFAGTVPLSAGAAAVLGAARLRLARTRQRDGGA